MCSTKGDYYTRNITQVYLVLYFILTMSIILKVLYLKHYCNLKVEIKLGDSIVIEISIKRNINISGILMRMDSSHVFICITNPLSNIKDHTVFIACGFNIKSSTSHSRITYQQHLYCSKQFITVFQRPRREQGKSNRK